MAKKKAVEKRKEDVAHDEIMEMVDKATCPGSGVTKDWQEAFNFLITLRDDIQCRAEVLVEENTDTD